MVQSMRVCGVLLTVLLPACQDPGLKTGREPGSSYGFELWYDQPAEDWMSEALPIGNGYLGAMFFGGTDRERIQLNEETLWSGGKGEWEEYHGGNRPNAYKHLPEVRSLLDKGEYEAAHKLANKELTGVIKGSNPGGGWAGYGAYQTLGDLFIEVDHSQSVSDYKRTLDIADAVGKVNYQDGQVKHRRTYFASYPRRSLVFHFENDAATGTDYSIELTTPHSSEISYQDGLLTLNGKVDNNGMQFQTLLRIDAPGSEINFENNQLQIGSAQEFTLYVTAATDYLNEYPDYKGRDYAALNHSTLDRLAEYSYQEILKEHLADYSELFDRVSLRLADQIPPSIPTDERLRDYGSGSSDPDLEVLFFQYGRYLLISSSRPGTMPANLQGKWNHVNNPPWACDYHANINIQMIYWPAEVTNLSECHTPLIEYIDKLRPPGRQTAKDFFNARGWIVNTMNNTFGFTAPGWEFPWGFFPGGAAWYARHVWEHYSFNMDQEYLQHTAYPIMKEAAWFWLDYLTKDSEGHLVSSPSYSPEHGGISTGAYMDIQIAWDLFTNTLEAGEVLGINDDFINQVETALAQLLPLRIGSWGQLQEWKEDVDDPDNKHRHVSHLYALYPGKQINSLETPELAEAAKVSLNARGDDGTGWSLGWKINFWSRLMDGDRAYTLLRRSLLLTEDSGVNMMDGGGVYRNMLSAHPPFQLDGNMGATSGMAEMLVQSHSGSIQLLPALPASWPQGKVSGLKTRGGLTLDLTWKDSQLVKCKVQALDAGSYHLVYHDLERVIELDQGESRSIEDW